MGPGPNQTDIDRAFAEAATEGIVIHRDGIVLAANAACCALYGYRPDEAAGRPVTDFMAPEARAEALRRGGAGVEEAYESLALHRDGSVFPVEFRGSAVMLDGNPARAVTIRDLTLRKREEQELHRVIDALRENEERFRTIIEALPHIAFIVRLDGVAEYYNGRCAAYFGPFPDDSPGRLEFVHPDDRGHVLAARREAVAVMGAFEVEIRLRRGDGAYRWHRFRSIPMLRDGALDAYLCTAIDIDELRRANEVLEQRVRERTAQLTASETQIRLFYEHASECHAVVVVRADGRFAFEEANAALLRLYGKPREEVVGYTIEAVLGAASAREVYDHLIECLQRGQPYRYERHQGKSVVEAVAVPVPRGANESRRLVITARDISESRLLEEQLRQAQKMEAVGQLTGGVAHDFNNLLTVIAGNLDMLEAKLTDPKHQKLAGSARRGAERAAILTHRLLAFSRKQPLAPKQVDLNRLVSGMSELVRRSLGEAITVETVLAAGLWSTNADSNQVENAILNLALNARDAMKGGGRLTIETANQALDDADARADPDIVPGQYVMLAVGDTGTGMSPETVAKAFEPFFTTKEVGDGSGLGLSMVYGFVKQSGGHVKIHSAIGEGTTIKIYLPRLLTSAAFVEPDVAAAIVGGDAGETILVVEDDADVRDYTGGVLRELGYRVVEARDATEALLCLDGPTRVDLLFTDVGLPGGVNGRGLAEAARLQRPGLKVLFTSGYPRNAIVHNGTLDAGIELIVKPFSQRDVAQKIRAILDDPILDDPALDDPGRSML